MLDLRLVPAALGCWVATIVALSLGWFAGVLLAVGAVVVAIALWVVWLWAVAHERERWRVVAVAGLAAMLLAAGFGAAGAWRAYHVDAHPLRESFGRTVSVVAVVTDDPKLMRADGFGGQRPWIVHAGLREFGSGSGTTRVGGSLVIIAQGAEWSALSPGQAIRFRGKVSEPTRSDLTVAALHPVAAPELVGVPPWWQRLATGVRADLSAAAARALSPAAAGLLPALVVGDTAALSDEVRDNFDITGLQHLAVVSGANFTILLTALLALTRLLTLGPRSSAIAAAGTVVVFVVLARPDPSVLRAAAMGSVTVLALLTGRRKQALPALGAAVIGLLGVAPYLAVSAGFALSVLATAGLILLAPSWADWLRARGWWRAPAEIVAVAAAAFVVTLPLMVALSGRVSLVAILANALVAPVVGVITVIGAMGAALAWLWGDAAVAVLWCARPPLWWLLSVADRLAAVPGATMAVPEGTLGGLVAAAIIVLLIAALRWSKTRRLLAVCALGVSTVLIPMRLWHPGWPPDGWAVAMCDVGQGDGLALAVGPHAAVVIDTGPDPRAIRRCLDHLDITHIPLLVLTHSHADHIDGLAGALRGRTITAIATAPGELDHSRPCPSTPRTGDETAEPQNITHPRTSTAPAHSAPSPDVQPRSTAPAHSKPATDALPGVAGTAQPVPSTDAGSGVVAPVHSGPSADAGLGVVAPVHSGPSADAGLGVVAPVHSGPSADAGLGVVAPVHSGPSTDARSGVATSARSKPAIVARSGDAAPAHSAPPAVARSGDAAPEHSAPPADARSASTAPVHPKPPAEPATGAPPGGAVPVRSIPATDARQRDDAAAHSKLAVGDARGSAVPVGPGPATNARPDNAAPAHPGPPIDARPGGAALPASATVAWRGSATPMQWERPFVARSGDAAPADSALSAATRRGGVVPMYLAPAAVARQQGALPVRTAPAAVARLESAVPARSELPIDARPGGPVPCCANGAAAPTCREHQDVEPEYVVVQGKSSGASGMAKVAELSKAAGVSLLELSAGQVLTFGAVELTVLAPAGDRASALDADEANDRSVVLSARTSVGTVLLTGDIEAAAQARVLRGGEVRADILKVPHHGSRTTTPEFLRAVRPRLALISSGADNTFGHPHPSITTALAALGATVARTDRDGDVVVFGTAAEPRVITARRRGPRGRKIPEPRGDDRAPPACRRANVGSPGERTPCRGTSGSR
ncbi:ComEC/Rec2 family competence protein [Nocardia asteroides]|uniref:ComEC/Rec2 family competence protein n=2 Tax=Nocardia asteroides TaxID=1824 RepID=UPI003656C3E9